jgi:hypothetical protein
VGDRRLRARRTLFKGNPSRAPVRISAQNVGVVVHQEDFIPRH